MNVKIERGVPLPPARNQRLYPYPQLEIGESFFVPSGRQAEIATQAWRWSKKLQRKFVTRTRPGGVRVWRIE